MLPCSKSFKVATMESTGEFIPCYIGSYLSRFGLIFGRITGVFSFRFQLVCQIISGHELFEEVRKLVVEAFKLCL